LINFPEARRFKVEGGRSLGYRHYAAQTSRRVLILIHGAGCFGDQMHDMGDAIARHDLASAVIQLAGDWFSLVPEARARI
jgi:hypothetical protein